MTRGRISFRSSGSTATPLVGMQQPSNSETLMSTRPKDVPKISAFYDMDPMEPAHPSSGVVLMLRLSEGERIKAEALALYYRATGRVSRDVPAELQDAAYDTRRGRLNPLNAIDQFATILVHRAMKRTLTRYEARQYAEQMLDYARQLIDLKLPVNPDPKPGRTVPITAMDRESVRHRGVGGQVGSFDGIEDHAA